MELDSVWQMVDMVIVKSLSSLGSARFSSPWLSKDPLKDWVFPDPPSTNRAKCEWCRKMSDTLSVGETSLGSHANMRAVHNAHCAVKNFCTVLEKLQMIPDKTLDGVLENLFPVP